MRKFYQSSWHGIQFKDFTKLDSKSLANDSFYKRFYKIFFRRYSNIHDLDPDWLHLKRNVIKQSHEQIFKSKES